MKPEPKRILLASDNIPERNLLREVISQLDKSLKTDIVVNGRQVLEYLTICPRYRLPCLIILDYDLSDLNSIQVLEKLKGDNTYNSIPKIVWSGFYSEAIKEHCIQAGAENCFPKILRPSELKVVARRMVEFCRPERQTSP